MGFRTGSYATIWSVESASDTRTKASKRGSQSIQDAVMGQSLMARISNLICVVTAWKNW